jgi:hypothetical protein
MKKMGRFAVDFAETGREERVYCFVIGHCSRVGATEGKGKGDKG